MAYTILQVDRYMDSLLDKLGSDYFPLPVKFGRFVTMTYDLVRANAKLLEANQEVTDDIMTLVDRKDVVATMIAGSNMSLVEAPFPADYFRLITIKPVLDYSGIRTIKGKLFKIVRQGQREAYMRDPHRTPTPFEPHIYRQGTMAHINVGVNSDTYNKAELTYVKKPTFGNINNDNDIIVNLPDIAVEQIMQKTCESLRFTTGDQSANDLYIFDQTFGKRNK